MKLKGKKQLNGQTVAIFDTEGILIEDIVKILDASNWGFNYIKVSYNNKEKKTVTKTIPYHQVKAIRSKYNFPKWSFSAVQGNKTLEGFIDCNKNSVAITKSTNGAIKELLALCNATATQKMENIPNKNVQHVQETDNATVPETSTTAVNALYTDYEEDEAIQSLSSVERNEIKQESRSNDEMFLENTKSKYKPLSILFIIFSLIELIPAPGFGIFALWDSIQGRRALKKGEPSSAIQYFNEAKILLIVGAFLSIVIIGILFWRFGDVITQLFT